MADYQTALKQKNLVIAKVALAVTTEIERGEKILEDT